MYGMDQLIQIIRREASNIVHSYARGSTFLVTTAYNPETHAVKGILQPTNVESNWVAIATHHASGGGGIAVGPKVGSADALDGDQFLVTFVGGDPDSPVAIGRLYSTADPPPQVQSGEMVFQHTLGTKVFMDQDGQLIHEHGPSGNTIVMAKDNSITITHKPSGSSYQIDKDGNHAVNTAGKALTINAASIALTGTATLNGQPIATA